MEYDQNEKTYFATTYQPYWLVDGSINWSSRRLIAFIAVSNVLGTNYTDAGSVTQPGRWFKAGVGIRLDFPLNEKAL
jgi:iron complex outermembrane receptor protein